MAEIAVARTAVAQAIDIVEQSTMDTPAYVYDLAEVRANRQRLREALPAGTELYYSLKANPHPAILATLRDLDCAPEVSSPGELAAALAAGWPAAQSLYTGPGKRDRDVRTALTGGVRVFSVDSPHGLDQLDQLAGATGVAGETGEAGKGGGPVRCLLRINDDRPAGGRGLAMTGTASQFGADASWVLAEPERFAGRDRVRLAGLHLYMGTNVPDVDHLLALFAQELATAVEIRERLRRYGAALEVLDLGGGFAAPFAKAGPPVALPGLREGLTNLLDEHVPGWRAGDPRITFESGRYLVGTAGTLVTRVLDVKRSHGKDVVVLDTGINHLGGMAGLRRLPPVNPDLVVMGDRGGRMRGGPADPAATAPTMVAGPLCTPLDSWSRGAALPPVRPGDLVAVPNVGAYGLYASLVAFLGHPAPCEVVVDGAAPVSVTHLDLTRRSQP